MGLDVMNVLVIEDDRDFCETLCKMLRRQGYHVLSSGSGLYGLRIFQENNIDLVITDILLPDRDGVNVILDIKKSSPAVKIIAISGGGRCATGQEYLKDVELLCDVPHTLEKPFHRDELMKMINEIMA